MTPKHRDDFLARAKDHYAIMGILNVTPDSFSDGALFQDPQMALGQASQMIKDGADILDIGAESTRPGANPISSEEEIARLRPLLSDIFFKCDHPISIDTYKAETAKWALKNGASIVNDVWGLQYDPDMAHVVADQDAGVILMHNRRGDAHDPDILADITKFFDHSLEIAQKAGIPRAHIVLDPGIGFGKSLEDNLTIFRNLEMFSAYGLPLLIGLSRKRFIGAILGKETDERLFGSVASNLYCFARGARVFRVHDVAPHYDALKMTSAIFEAG